MSHRVLAERLGVHKARVGQIYGGNAHRVHLFQRWARAVGRRLTLDVEGLNLSEDGDALAAVYDAQQPTDPAACDQLLLRRVVNDLARIRRSRMYAAEFGVLIGRCENAVLWREEHPDGAHLALVQQTARALGGRLSVGLAPVEVPHAAV